MPAVELKRVLSLYLGAGGLYAGLFVNDHQPGADDYPDGNNYEEPSWDGYARLLVEQVGELVEQEAEAYAPLKELVWLPPEGASGIVYGVFVWHEPTAHLVSGVRFRMPKTVVPGEPITGSIRCVAASLGVA